jgi:hypothetical protein
MYLNFINYFRAIAIMIIVAGHCFTLSDFSFTSNFGNIILNLIVGGTSFFVFISGFLFHHVFYKNFNYSKFMKNKIKFVLSPYLLIYSPLVIFYVFIGNHINDYFVPTGDSPIDLYIIPIIKYYLTGYGTVAYWYIPFVMIIFLISPLFIPFIRLGLRSQLLIIFPLLLIAMLIHRPVEYSAYGAIHSVFYFIPIYLIGIISSQNKTLIYSILKGKAGYLFISGIILSAISLFFGKVANPHKSAFSYEGFDLMIIQKIALCFAFMTWLGRYENNKNKFMNLISENSFGIFFIHPILLILVEKIKRTMDFKFPINNFLIYIVFSTLIFSLSLLITILIKRAFPTKSRYIIGS